MALLEGAFINVCLPGNSQDVSLSLSFAKFSKTFVELSHGNVSSEVSFFKSLIPVILRHKARLNKTVRDVIISTWLDWLKTSTPSNLKYNTGPPRGSIDSAAHEYLIFLLNEWASSFGNILMPRDLLLKVSTEVVKVVNSTETAPDRKMSALWKANDGEAGFAPVKAQYERLLTLLPESHASQWKEAAGIAKAISSSNDETKDKITPMETDD